MKTLLLIVALVTLAYMSLWYVISLWKKRNDIVDIGWGLGFVVVAFSALFLEGNFTAKAVLLCVLVLLWGIRLASHIYLRNRGKKEDFRYKKWREEWEHFYLRSYFQIYVLQGILMLVISLPVLVAIKYSEGISTEFLWLDFLGLAIWVFGFLFEAVSDWQLKKYIEEQEEAGIMTDGLWQFSRHPNYFGEVAQWWGIWLIASTVEYGLFTIIGPILITFLILRVSGIPPLEKKLSGDEEYEDYKRKTSKFFPLPPKQ